MIEKQETYSKARDMPGFYQIKYLPEGRVERFAGSRGNYYEFADGSHLDVDTEPVWCPRCLEVTHGESIPSVDELDKELADLDDPASDLYRFIMRSLVPELEPPGFRENLRQKRIEEISKRREWRLSRHSPAKCIHCGCTEIISLPYDQTVTVATDPKLVVVVSIEGMCSTDFNEWYFTPEGDRIARDTKPTYWRLPGVSPEEERQLVKRFLDKFEKETDDK